MGRRLKWKPGSWYRQDDRTGLVQRAEKTRKQWDGLIVDERRWEPRHPQDLVKGVRDDQSVPDARPLPPPTYIGPIATTLAQTAVPQAGHFYPAESLGLQVGSVVGIVLDDGTIIREIVEYLPGDGSFYGSALLPCGAASGNEIIAYGITAPIIPYLTLETGIPLVTEADQLIFP